MTKASDNPYPSILITEGTEPSAPAAGKQRLYIDSTSHKLKRTDSSGTDVTIEGLVDPMTTRGDIVVRDSSNATARLAVGSAGKILGSDGTDVAWGNGPMTTRGDVITAGASGAIQRLALGASGKSLRSDGTDVGWGYPPGYQFAAGAKTSSTSITATTEATADTIVTASSFAFDGSTTAFVEFYAFSARPDLTASGRSLSIYLYDDTGGGAASIGRIALFNGPAAVADNKPCLARYFLTPSSATHTFSVRAAVSAGTGNVGGGAGGSGADMPTYIRVFKAG